jgi:hypothetical protein
VSFGRPSFSFEAITSSIVSTRTENSPSASSIVATSSNPPIAAASGTTSSGPASVSKLCAFQPRKSAPSSSSASLRHGSAALSRWR